MPVSTGTAIGGATTGVASAPSVRSGVAVPSEQSSRFSFRKAGYSGVADFLRQPTWSILITTDDEVLITGGIWPVTPGTTVYISGNGADERLMGTTGVPGLIKRFRYGADVPPGPGQTYTYTIFKNGVATASSFVVTGSIRKGKSDVQVTCNDEDELCVKVEVSAGAPLANHSGTIQIAPAV